MNVVVAEPEAQPPAPRGPGARPVGAPGIICLLVYLIALSLLLIYGLLVLWPYPTPAGGQTPTVSSVFAFGLEFQATDEVRLLLIVALSGAMGGLVHALRSVYWYVGNRDLVLSWLAMYVLLPFIGTTLAVIFYLVIRGGFFSPQATVQQTSPFGFAALAGMVGMFSPQAALKLKHVAETILDRPEPGENAAGREG